MKETLSLPSINNEEKNIICMRDRSVANHDGNKQ